MKTIELIGQVDEQHRLIAEVPASVPAGPVKIVVLLAPDADDPEGKAWAQAISQAWADDWSDPREDIYTLEDCEPVDQPRT
jgi:hypothetical protein